MMCLSYEINQESISNKLELYRLFNQKQEKYTYYIIALSVTCIGYSVHMTNGKSLVFWQWPLGIAILSWGLSVYLGLKYIRTGLSVIHDNIDLIDMNEGRHPATGQHPQMIAAGRKTLLDIINEKSNQSSSLHTWQNRCFYLGMIFFIIWRIVEMHLSSI